MRPAREWAEVLYRFRPSLGGDQDPETFVKAFAAMIAIIQQDAGASPDECEPAIPPTGGES